MDAQAISDIFAKKPKGSIFQITVRRPGKTYKGTTQVVEKESHYQGQFTDYANRAPVREAVAAGERDAPELPSHIKESFMVGNVRFWRGHNGKEYFPMPITGNKPKVQWFVDGNPVDYATVEPLLTAADKTKPRTKEEAEGQGQALFNAITLENIVSVA